MAGDGGGGGGRTSSRTPSWKERENNRRRERRRRAISAKIFTGLRTFGNYSLPKHCDNNEVLKALCHEAGWTVEPDGTTYRKGRKPPLHMDVVQRPASLSVSPCSSSYHPSPYASFNPSPVSSSLASPASSSYTPNYTNNFLEGGSLIPWLKNLSSASASSSKLPHVYAFGGRSISAPVTPPFSSSPGLMSAQTLTPLQSGTCSPAVGDVPMTDQFVFRSGGVEGTVVKAWEGERIHDDCSDELELTLGCSKTR